MRPATHIPSAVATVIRAVMAGLLCLSAASGGSAGAAITSQSPLTVDDWVSLARLSKPVLSPDGRWAALVVSRADAAQKHRTTSLVVIDTQSGGQRVVAAGGARPAWSPRGAALAWLAPEGGAPQIFKWSMDGTAAPVSVTHTAHGAGVRAFAWSPDGESLAYLAAHEALPAADHARDSAFEALDADYLGTSYLTRSRGEAPACLWTVGVRGGEPRQVTCEAGFIETLVWSADGKTLLINSHPGASVVSQRFGSVSAVAEDGRITTVVPSPANVGALGAMSVSSRGWLAYPHFRGQDPWLHQSNVAVIREAPAADATAALDRHILDFGWLPDGNSLLVEAREQVRTALWSVGMEGTVHRIALGPVDPTDDGVAVSSRANTVAFVGTEAARAQELYVLPSLTAVPRRLTHFNEAVNARRLGTVKIVVWHSDGYEHDGVLTFPPDYRADQAYPLLMSIHGGPHTSAQLTFNAESQFYAAQGWLVFEPNYRGSDGRGERYRTAVIGDATAGPGRDLRAGLDAVKGEAHVDAQRVALTGYSYGGVMTSWLIGHHQDWCAAIAGGVVVDFKGYYDQSDTGIWIASLLGSPHRPGNRQAYVEQSPTTYLDRATTPTLIMQDVGDDNAPVGQAYELFHALKDNGVPANLIAFDVEGHDPDDPQREKEMALRTLSWMNEHCAANRH